MFLSGRGPSEQDERGRALVDSDFLMLFNAHHDSIEFHLPAQPADARWQLLFDTSQPQLARPQPERQPGEIYRLAGRALAVFEFAPPAETS